VSNRHSEWLAREIPQWVADGLIDADQGARIAARYPAPESRDLRRLQTLIFGAVGAVLVAAGVVLLVAHDWAAWPPAVRVAVAIGQLLAFQAAAAWALFRRRESTVWREAAATCLAASFVAAFTLVTLTYPISDDARAFFLVCGLLVAPLSYVFDAQAPAAAAAFFFAAVAGANPDSAVPCWTFWIGVALLAPKVWLLARDPDREWRLLSVFLAGCLFIGGCISLDGAQPARAWMIYLGGALAATAALGGKAAAADAGAWRRPPAALARWSIPGFALIYTFEAPWRVSKSGLDGLDAAGAVGLAAGAAGAIAALLLARKSGLRERVLAAFGVVAAAAVLLAASPAPAQQLLLDLFLAALAAAAIVEGIRAARFGATNYGLCVAVALAGARFFDSDLSFLARGLLFISAGAGVVAANWVVASRRRGEGP